MTKQELRKFYRAKRQSIPAGDKQQLDLQLLAQLKKLPLLDFQNLLSYFPILDQNEPDTISFARSLQQQKNIFIAYPVANFTDLSLQAVVVNESTRLQQNKYGITEPINGATMAPQSIDVAFIPLFICDNEGFRVGYGKGFYDRYLPQCRATMLRIGFSYFHPVEKISDRNRLDIALHYCITPQQTYVFI